MCGIYGVFAKAKNGFSNTNMDTLADLAFVNQTRGWDSSGVIYYDGKDNIVVKKEVGGWGDLIQQDGFQEFWKNILRDGKCVIGHGRAATKGKVSIENAHPFQVPKNNGQLISLVHNGTLDTYQPLGGTDKYQVDSHWMAAKIAELGPEEALSKINGAIASVWFDHETKKVCIYRNDQRPLFVAKDKIGSVYIASDPAFLMFTKYRRSLSFEYEDVKFFSPLSLYVLDPHNLQDWEKIVKIEKKVHYPPPVRYSPRNWRDGFDDDWSGSHLYDMYGTPKEAHALEVARNILDNKNRGMLWDVSYVHAGVFGSVQFDHVSGTRTTEVFDKQGAVLVSRSEKAEPYVKNLRRIVKVGDDVHCFFADGMHMSKEIWTKDQINAQFQLEAKKKEKEAPKEQAKVLTLPNHVSTKVRPKPGKRFRFHTRSKQNVPIVHSALPSAKDAHEFVEYKNDMDGEFAVGDVITVEQNMIHVNALVIDGKSYNYVSGFRVKPDSTAMDVHIDFGFYTQYSSPEIHKIGIFTGKIERIKFASDKYNKKTGAIVLATLTDVHPTGEADLTQAVQSTQVVVLN